MERIEAIDFALKLFGIADNAQDEGFDETKIKLDSLRLLKKYRGQDNYEDLRQATESWLATREIRLTAQEKVELHRGNLEYFL